jgi:stage III sporulation protein AA
MGLSFLPSYIKSAIDYINYNNLSEIRLRKGQPILIEYNGEYCYLSPLGVTDKRNLALICGDVSSILNSATEGCIYKYTEQIKNGFITVSHGIRIGIAGEFITESDKICTIASITSLNIRIPHTIYGCSDVILKRLYKSEIVSSIIFSKPGLGKTTYLRDIATNIGEMHKCNVLIFDERGEISAIDGNGNGFDLGERVDVIRSHKKLYAINCAVRAMKPQVVITDELYGEDDFKAVKYCIDCGIAVISSTHIVDKKTLQKLPFRYFIELTKIGGQPIIYDKNFNIVGDSCIDVSCGSNSI